MLEMPASPSADDNRPSFKNPVARRAYDYFCEILKIPHGSGNEKALSDYLMSFAEKHGLDAAQDESLNVLIRKPGSRLPAATLPGSIVPVNSSSLQVRL